MGDKGLQSANWLFKRDHHYEIVKLLVEAGQGVDVEYDGKTALFLAVEIRHTDIVKYLAEKGAEAEVKYEGKTALHLAVEKGSR